MNLLTDPPDDPVRLLPPNRATGRSLAARCWSGGEVTDEAANLPYLLGFAPIHGSAESEAERVRAGTNDRAMARKRIAGGLLPLSTEDGATTTVYLLGPIEPGGKDERLAEYEIRLGF